MFGESNLFILTHYFRRWVGVYLALQFLTGCAYRFTNVAMKPPPGVMSIAIESIYDTSREVIPHELLWDAIQREFARNGRIRLTNRQDADALMTIHLLNANITPSGTPNAEGSSRDPIIDGDKITDPYTYKNLRRAGNWTITESLGYTIDVKIHNLRTKEIIFNRSYNTTGSFRSVRASAVADPKTGFLLYDEALDTRFNTISSTLAYRIVTDFLL